MANINGNGHFIVQICERIKQRERDVNRLRAKKIVYV